MLILSLHPETSKGNHQHKSTLNARFELDILQTQSEMSNLQKKQGAKIEFPNKSLQICEEQRNPHNLEQSESLSVMKIGESTVHDYFDEKLVKISPSLKIMTSPEEIR